MTYITYIYNIYITHIYIPKKGIFSIFFENIEITNTKATLPKCRFQVRIEFRCSSVSTCRRWYRVIQARLLVGGEIWRIPLLRRRMLACRVVGRLPTGSRVTMRNCLLRMSDNHEHPICELPGLCEPVHIGIPPPRSPLPLPVVLTLSFAFSLLILYRNIYLLGY